MGNKTHWWESNIKDVSKNSVLSSVPLLNIKEKTIANRENIEILENLKKFTWQNLRNDSSIHRHIQMSGSAASGQRTAGGNNNVR